MPCLHIPLDVGGGCCCCLLVVVLCIRCTSTVQQGLISSQGYAEPTPNHSTDNVQCQSLDVCVAHSAGSAARLLKDQLNAMSALL